MMPFKKNLPAAGSGFSDYYVPEDKFSGPPSPKNLATPLISWFIIRIHRNSSTGDNMQKNI